MGKTIAITGAKGGCGKTLLTGALGAAIAAAGKKVCLVDGCIGLRGLDILLGVQDRVVFDWLDLCEKTCSVEQALIPAERLNVRFIAAPQQEIDMGEIPEAFCKLTDRLKKRFDAVLLDIPGDLTPFMRQVCADADEAMLISVPGDAAARNAERMASLLYETRGGKPISLVMNFFEKHLVTRGKTPAPDAVAAYLDLPLIGLIPASEALGDALFDHKLPDEYPERVKKAVEEMAQRLEGKDVPLPSFHERRFPWHS